MFTTLPETTKKLKMLLSGSYLVVC